MLGHDKLAAAATKRNFLAKKAASYQFSEILLFGEQSLPERGEEVVKNPNFTLGNCKLNVSMKNSTGHVKIPKKTVMYMNIKI